MGGHGKSTVLQDAPETKPCAPPGTTDEYSGSDGPGTMSEAGSKRKCAASRPSATATPRETQTAEIQIRIALMNRFSALGTELSDTDKDPHEFRYQNRQQSEQD
jgi:hypothetical protein